MVSYDWTITAFDWDFIISLYPKLPEVKKMRRKAMLYYGIFAAVFFLGMIYYLICPYAAGSSVDGVCTFLGLLGFCFLLLCLLLPFKQKQAMRRSIQTGDPRLFSGTRHLEFREDGVAVSSDLGNSLKFWSGFRYWGSSGAYLFLVDVSNSYILIDRRLMLESDQKEIEALFRSRQIPFLDLP